MNPIAAVHLKAIQGVHLIRYNHPYSYASVTLGITCLTDLGLCEKLQQGQRNKAVHFELKGADLWKQARPYLQSPVVKLVYCEHLDETDAPICGINALAHYTMLNSESEQTVIFAIAVSGNSGRNTTGPHLHVSCRWGGNKGKYFNPALILEYITTQLTNK